MVTEVNQVTERKPDGVFHEQVVRETLQKYVLWLSRIRRNWIEAEVERRASEKPRQVLGETYEVPNAGATKPGDAPFTKLR